MDSVKIAFLTHIHPHVTQTFTFNEIRYWRKFGLAVDVFSIKKPNAKNAAALTPEMKQELKTTTYLPAFSLSRWINGLGVILRQPKIAFETFRQAAAQPYSRFTTLKLKLQALAAWFKSILLIPLIRERGYTHLHAEFADNAATMAWIISRFSGIPFSFRSHTSYNPQLLQTKLHDAGFVLSISEFDRNFLMRETGEENLADKILVNHLGVNCAGKFSYQDGTSPNLILCVGTLQEKKGQLFLIKACGILNRQGIPFRCVLVGDGAMRERLNQEIATEKLQEKIKILGYIPNHEVKALMSQATVICIPSIITAEGDLDGIPFVLIEAMAMGKTCISTSVSGIPELIAENVDGLLVPPKAPEILADALKRVLHDAALRERLGRAARQKIEKNFNAESNARECIQLFQNATPKKMKAI